MPLRSSATSDASSRVTRDALEAADRVVVGLVTGDGARIERELDLSMCAWWRDGDRLTTLHGPTAVARALLDLVERHRPERLASRATAEGSVLVSALRDDRLAWSLELRAAAGRFVGCIVRGAGEVAPADRRDDGAERATQ